MSPPGSGAAQSPLLSEPKQSPCGHSTPASEQSPSHLLRGKVPKLTDQLNDLVIAIGTKLAGVHAHSPTPCGGSKVR